MNSVVRSLIFVLVPLGLGPTAAFAVAPDLSPAVIQKVLSETLLKVRNTKAINKIQAEFKSQHLADLAQRQVEFERGTYVPFPLLEKPGAVYNSAGPLGLATPEAQPFRVQIRSPKLLIVNHASDYYDDFASAKVGIDREVETAKRENATIVYLVQDMKVPEEQILFYPSFDRPDYAFRSGWGEHAMRIESNDITLTGGYFGGCLEGALGETIRGLEGQGPFTIHYPMSAIYSDRQERLLDAFWAVGKNPERMFKEVWLNLIDRTYADPEAVSVNPSHVSGFIDLNRYTLNILIDGKLVRTRGTGEMTVNLSLESR